MAIQVNSGINIGATATSSTPYGVTIPTGTGIIAGDLIIVNAVCDGTHVLHGMTVQDSVNLSNYTNINDAQLGSTSQWQQTFYFVTNVNIPDGSTITLTPYASAANTAFTVDIFRYVLNTIVNAGTTQSNTANTAQGAPALGAAPIIGSLVLTFDAAAAGNLTPGTAFTAGSAISSTGAACATAFATADGVSTFASTWTDSSTAVSATQTIAFKNASVGVAYAIASASQAPGSASTVATVTTASVANDALFVVAGCGAGFAVQPTGVTDSKSHTWTLIGTTTVASGMAIYIYQSLNAVTTMAVNDTVTVAWSGTNYAKNVLVLGCAGINHTLALDQSVSDSGSGTNHPVITTQTSLINNNELAIAIVTSGYLSGGVTWGTPWTDLTAGGLHNGQSVYTSVAVQSIINNTAPVNASAYLGVSAVYAELLLTFIPDPPAAPASTLTITNTSPLPVATLGTAYSDTLNATGGVPPYTWTNTGSWPPGITMTMGGGGGNGPVRSGGWSATAPTGFALSDWVTDYTKFGFTGHNGAGLFGKVFTPDLAHTTWSALTGTNDAAASISAAYPGFIPMLSWSTTLISVSAITTFCNTVPAGQVVAFAWQSEQEGPGNTGANSATASQFQTGMANIFNGIHASGSINSRNMFNFTASYMPYYQSGGNLTWLPPSSVVDGYGADEYYHLGSPPATGMQDDAKFRNWLTLVLGLIRGASKYIAIPEYGIDINNGGSAAIRAQYLQRDVTWINNNFGPNHPVISPLPIFGWMYWDKKTQTPTYGPLTDATAINIWGSMCKAAQTGTGGGAGGLVSGIPTGAGTFNVTVTVKDSVAPTPNSFSKAFTLVVNPLNTGLSIITTSLVGGNVNVPYSASIFAQGGTPNYTWSVTTGSLPAGVSISSVGSPAAGVLSGTPSGVGTSSFTVRVLDSVGASATQPLTLAIAPGLTITTTTLPPGVVGTPYSQTLGVSGGSGGLTWSIATGSGTGTLPAGLSIDPNLGVISGTPTTVQVSPFTATVTDSANQTATQPLSISITSSVPVTGIGRRQFGGDMPGWTFSISGGGGLLISPGATVTFYSALTGGTQYLDLLDINGLPVTSVITDSAGEIPVFSGPAGIWLMAADANNGAGPRRWYLAADIGTELTLLHNALAALGALGT